MDFDFSLFLVLSTLVTGVIWGCYALYVKIKGHGTSEPLIVDYARSFFPILLLVLLLRSFLVEPFRIPSGSMMPTLLVGDFILVNKFAYGVRLPVLHNKLIDIGEPKRGDIVVFRFPNNPAIDYIKRVVGLPGDRITYRNKLLYVNNTLVKETALGRYQGFGQGKEMTGAIHLIEELGDADHSILLRNGVRSKEGEFVVPEGQYFVMGDNRDNSNDSRYWGYVPEGNLVGKAFLIWMAWDWDNGGIGLGRIGSVLK